MKYSHRKQYCHSADTTLSFSRHRENVNIILFKITPCQSTSSRLVHSQHSFSLMGRGQVKDLSKPLKETGNGDHRDAEHRVDTLHVHWSQVSEALVSNNHKDSTFQGVLLLSISQGLYSHLPFMSAPVIITFFPSWCDVIV